MQSITSNPCHHLSELMFHLQISFLPDSFLLTLNRSTTSACFCIHPFPDEWKTWDRFMICSKDLEAHL
jgi:hypothetical protein